MVNKFDSEQARAIRVALENGRQIAAWSATVNDSAGDRRIAIVLAVTARAATSLAAELGGVVRVGPAHVRDLQGAIDRALAKRPELPAHAAAPVAAPSERERAREYLRGVAERPGDGAVYAVLGRAVVRRAAGQPRGGVNVGVQRQPGTPFVGEYTLRSGKAAA
jgi:hypothetical protein